MPVAEGPAAPWVDRMLALAAVGAAVWACVLLAGIRPDPRGYGTHEALGMLACGWPAAYGIPCPTCGVTTAACHVVHLAPLRAFATQPFGASLALAGLGLAGFALYCLVRGRSFLEVLVRLPLARLLLGAIALLFLSWGYVYLRL
ncbi:MAG: DUF2752 domain-containing protein [Planctomycetes bacterium]|nr:DUF2752 domain-containing protein [Planctomycetota bacterium]